MYHVGGKEERVYNFVHQVLSIRPLFIGYGLEFFLIHIQELLHIRKFLFNKKYYTIKILLHSNYTKINLLQ